MPVTVIVGAQFGGEGKGKTTAYLSLTEAPALVVRCGGPNSGHTVSINGNTRVVRLVPAGFVCPTSRLLIAPGAIVEPSLLFREISMLGLRPDRLGIDSSTGIIEGEDTATEESWGLTERIGSTRTGMGAAVARRAARSPSYRLASEISELKPWITDVSQETNSAIDANQSVIVEGTQGFGLSLFHSAHYPYVTSRDTSAAAFLSEVGLSPRLTSRVILVVRTFPIRVGGHSGPLHREIDWRDVKHRSGSPVPVEEYTTVTGRLRRVGEFDEDLVRRASRLNRPTHIVVNGLDLIDWRNRNVRDGTRLTQQATEFLERVETATNSRLFLGGVGPDVFDFAQLGPATEPLLEIVERERA